MTGLARRQHSIVVPHLLSTLMSKGLMFVGWSGLRRARSWGRWQAGSSAV